MSWKILFAPVKTRLWYQEVYIYKSQSLDTDVQRPFYFVAIVALLPY